jgi:type VI secretion system secreted protein VgrG
MAAIGTSTTFTFKIDGLNAHTSVARFEGEEAISELCQFELTLTSDDNAIAFADVVGKPAQLTLETDQHEPRYVHGIVSRFRLVEEGKMLTVYHATLVPKLWRLKHRQDSRIFQDLAVPAILEKVLQGAGLAAADYRLSIKAAHPTREYCVQYRESDHAFISRLMEEEGIYYFFEHSDGKDVLVMGDSPSATGPIAGASTIAYKGTLGAMAHGESVSRFSYGEEVQPGKVSLSDFNFKKPSLSLLTSSAAKDDSDLEVYDYPGEYEVPGDGTALSKVRLEEWQSLRVVAEGDSGCARLLPGYRFTLGDHARDDANQEYLLTRLRSRGVQQQMGQTGPTGGESYINSFHAIPSKVPYRPERRTPRPTLKGVQTAIVTGAGGEEIHTDEHGRVKVQFHWDRQGKKDDKSSCWIRVSQLWAGAGWGAMWIPRVGHEVIVDFIEGDPDRPIIVGRVYHGTNVPPYALPGEKTKSTIKSNSSTGGGGSNELRFEDRKGSEEVYLHGQKDWNIKIEHDKNQLIGHDETKKVGNDETQVIGHDRKKEIRHDQREDVFHDDTITVGGDRREGIGGNETVQIGSKAQRTVGADQAVGIGANSTINVGANLSESVGGSMHLSVGAGKNENVGADSSSSVGANLSTTVGGAHTLSVGKSLNTSVGKDHAETVEDNRTITVGKKLTISVGESVITVEKDGTITVKGKDITVKGDGTIHVQGGSKVMVKSDGPVSVEASGEVKVKGSAVNLN